MLIFSWRLEQLCTGLRRWRNTAREMETETKRREELKEREEEKERGGDGKGRGMSLLGKRFI